MGIEQKIYDMMSKDRLHGEVWNEFGKVYAVEIFWGDWKHDHWRLDYLIKENFPEAVHISTKTTEDNGSDCYSAIHYYYFG